MRIYFTLPACLFLAVGCADPAKPTTDKAQLPADAPRDDPIKHEVRRLEGTWKCVKLEGAGKQVPAEKLKEANFQLIFKGDKLTFKKSDDSSEVSYSIDPTSKPKSIDTKHPRGRTGKGIYELDGDRLKICDAGHADRERPKDFTTEAGSPQTVMILEREKE